MKQRQMQQAGGTAHTAAAQQHAHVARTGLEIDHGRDGGDNAGPVIKAGRCVQHPTRISPDHTCPSAYGGTPLADLGVAAKGSDDPLGS